MEHFLLFVIHIYQYSLSVIAVSYTHLALYADFSKDANAQLENGNKAAGTRARKASLEIEKAMKEFRKASLEASKK